MKLRSSFYCLFVFLNISIFANGRSEPTCIKGKRAKKLNKKIIKEHNKFRSKHGVPALELDLKLIKEATDWSYQQAKKGIIEHSKGRERFGENIAKWFTLDDKELPLVQAWYDKIDKYKAGDFSIETVWKTTGKLGCGVCADSEGKNLYITCRYFSSGNNQAEFKANVLPPKSKHTTNHKGTSTKRPTKNNDGVSTPDLKQDSEINKIFLLATTIYLLLLSSLPVAILFTIMYKYFIKK